MTREDTKCYAPDNVTTTGSTLFGKFETTFASLMHLLHGIAVRENQPEVAEALVISLTNSWEQMKKNYNITLE